MNIKLRLTHQQASKNSSPQINAHNLNSILSAPVPKTANQGIRNRSLVELRGDSESSSDSDESVSREFQSRTINLTSSVTQINDSTKPYLKQLPNKARPGTNQSKFVEQPVQDNFIGMFNYKGNISETMKEQKALEMELWKEFDNLEQAVQDSRARRQDLLLQNNQIFEQISSNKEFLIKLTNKYQKLFKNKNTGFGKQWE